MDAESGFDGGKVSGGGTIGFAQVLPATAAALQPDVEAGDLLDPRVNLRVGFRLLRRLLQAFSGDTARAVQAYHVGPRRAVAGAWSAEVQRYVESLLAAARSARWGYVQGLD